MGCTLALADKMEAKSSDRKRMQLKKPPTNADSCLHALAVYCHKDATA